MSIGSLSFASKELKFEVTKVPDNNNDSEYELKYIVIIVISSKENVLIIVAFKYYIPIFAADLANSLQIALLLLIIMIIYINKYIIK